MKNLGEGKRKFIAVVIVIILAVPLGWIVVDNFKGNLKKVKEKDDVDIIDIPSTEKIEKTGSNIKETFKQMGEVTKKMATSSATSSKFTTSSEFATTSITSTISTSSDATSEEEMEEK